MSNTEHITSWLAAPAIFGIILSILAGACTTTEKKVDQKELPTHFTLEMEKQAGEEPLLATGYPIQIKWFYGEQLVATDPAFKGWDFNNDERIDMLEQWDSNTKSVKLYYDFDFDGKIDAMQVIAEGDARKKLKSPEMRIRSNFEESAK